MNGPKVDTTMDTFAPEPAHIRRQFGQSGHTCQWTEQSFRQLIAEGVSSGFPLVHCRLPGGFRQSSWRTAGQCVQVGRGQCETDQLRRVGAHAGEQPAQLRGVFCDLASCHSPCSLGVSVPKAWLFADVLSH